VIASTNPITGGVSVRVDVPYINSVVPAGPAGPVGPQGPKGDPGLQGPPAFTLVGAFQSGTSYEALNAVTFNYGTYVAINSNQGAKTPDNDPANWKLLVGPAVHYRGAYSNDDDYSSGDLVTYNGAVYIAHSAISAEPGSNMNAPGGGADWQVFVPPGAAGPAGPAGAAGLTGAAATLQIGNVATLPAGSNATVVNNGTATDAVLFFGIPAGVDGKSLNPRGDWDSSATYNRNDMVQHNGASWVALQDGVGTMAQPGLSTLWGKVAADGAPGQTGAAGSPGPQGAAATIQVGTVTGLPAGSAPTIVNSGTPFNAVLNFGLPSGADGKSLNPRGEWDSSATYNRNDMVQHNGASWVALQDGVGTMAQPGLSTLWQRVASDGTNTNIAVDNTLTETQTTTGNMVNYNLAVSQSLLAGFATLSGTNVLTGNNTLSGLTNFSGNIVQAGSGVTLTTPAINLGVGGPKITVDPSNPNIVFLTSPVSTPSVSTGSLTFNNGTNSFFLALDPLGSLGIHSGNPNSSNPAEVAAFTASGITTPGISAGWQIAPGHTVTQGQAVQRNNNSTLVQAYDGTGTYIGTAIDVSTNGLVTVQSQGNATVAVDNPGALDANHSAIQPNPNTGNYLIVAANTPGAVGNSTSQFVTNFGTSTPTLNVSLVSTQELAAAASSFSILGSGGISVSPSGNTYTITAPSIAVSLGTGLGGSTQTSLGGTLNLTNTGVTAITLPVSSTPQIGNVTINAATTGAQPAGAPLPLTGDVTGSTNSNTVTAVQGLPWSQLTPSIGEGPQWDGTRWYYAIPPFPQVAKKDAGPGTFNLTAALTDPITVPKGTYTCPIEAEATANVFGSPAGGSFTVSVKLNSNSVASGDSQVFTMSGNTMATVHTLFTPSGASSDTITATVIGSGSNPVTSGGGTVRIIVHYCP
jgi:hypothetical protein